jgi:hypothetical protein
MPTDEPPTSASQPPAPASEPPATASRPQLEQPVRARLPRSAPTKADLAERDQYARLVAGSADAVRASAQAWRTGLTAFITLVTTGAVIQGRNSTASLPAAWRAIAITAVGGGLLLAVLGLWQALAAEAGTRPKQETLQDIRDAHGSLAAYQAHLAEVAGIRLRWGIRAATAAITLLFAGIVVTWVAPAGGSAPPMLVAVHGTSATCGALASSGGGELRLTVTGGAVVTIPLAQITSLAVTSTCP